MKGIMIQGTSSDAGKSFITTALCAIFKERGNRVAPFKSQNMSNNSYVTKDGKEIGRAQGIQAEAAQVEAMVEMNPILLKPQSERGAEVVLRGERYRPFDGRAYREQFYEKGLEVVEQSLKTLSEQFDVLVMEGAGSPVEINLNDRELVNMKIAEMADVPVLLVADIERGGVFASIVGTLQLLSEEERKRVKGIIINKFRGDLSLFEDGRKWLESYTGIKVVGVIPYYEGHMVDSEDSLSMTSRFKERKGKVIDLAVIKLPYISNYTDIEPFLFEEDVSIRLVHHADEFGSPDALILPGTKSTIHDLKALQKSRLDKVIQAYVQNGGTMVGICGGYQMMCEALMDESGLDTGKVGYKEAGLNLIRATTTFTGTKKTVRNEGIIHQESGFPSLHVKGYEIHLGVTHVHDESASPFLVVEGGVEGISLDGGRILGTYFHHLFENDEFRHAWLTRLREQKQLPKREVVWLKKEKANQYTKLANYMKKYLDIDYIETIMEEWGEKRG